MRRTINNTREARAPDRTISMHRSDTFSTDAQLPTSSGSGPQTLTWSLGWPLAACRLLHARRRRRHQRRRCRGSLRSRLPRRDVRICCRGAAFKSPQRRLLPPQKQLELRPSMGSVAAAAAGQSLPRRLPQLGRSHSNCCCRAPRCPPLVARSNAGVAKQDPAPLRHHDFQPCCSLATCRTLGHSSCRCCCRRRATAGRPRLLHIFGARCSDRQELASPTPCTSTRARYVQGSRLCGGHIHCSLGRM